MNTKNSIYFWWQSSEWRLS